jgi:peptide deformylase
MAKLPLLLYPNLKLRQRSAQVDPALVPTEAFKKFLSDLAETLTWYRGIGISAIQCGVPDAVFLMRNTKGEILQFVNPVVEDRDGEKVEMEEGCLSIPGFTEKVKRYPNVVVSCLNLEDGGRRVYDLEGIEAQCAQHEMEHLAGAMFSDGYGVAKRDLVKRKIQKALRHDPRFKPETYWEAK